KMKTNKTNESLKGFSEALSQITIRLGMYVKEAGEIEFKYPEFRKIMKDIEDDSSIIDKFLENKDETLARRFLDLMLSLAFIDKRMREFNEFKPEEKISLGNRLIRIGEGFHDFVRMIKKGDVDE
ncbi:MAG: hypothetical protein ACTSW1_07410, partial [Candidatus Hodarchaeales archaeon]